MTDIFVKIYSHSRSHPIASADYKYDLRRISNPPREMRRQFDGRAKRIKEHLLRDPTFSEMLDDAATEIENACSRATGATATTSASPGMDESIAIDSIERKSPIRTLVDDDPTHDTLATDEDSDSFDASTGKQEPLENVGGGGIVITVSCFCERGKHRSVAFAEELAKRLRYWAVDVEHRDIDQKPARSRRSKDRHRIVHEGYGSEDE